MGAMVANSIYKTACRIACAAREIGRHTDANREALQHFGSRKIVDFFKMPATDLAQEIADILIKTDGLDRVRIVRRGIKSRFDLELHPLPVYKPRKIAAEKLIQKEIEKTTNIHCKMVTIVDGTNTPLGSKGADRAYNLGQKLAKEGIVVICYQTSGILHPLLRGFIDHNGFSIGVFPITEEYDENLVKLKIIVPPLRTISAITATLSGRALIVFGADRDPLADDCMHAAAYKGIPAILIDTELPLSARSALQAHLPTFAAEELLPVLKDIIFLDGMPEHFTLAGRSPISYFAGTKFRQDHPSQEMLIRFAKAFGENGYFTISGAGPGPMSIVDGEMLCHVPTVGMCFFPTYLASNKNTVLPIITSYEKESRDAMALSSIASVNFGGADTTWREIDSVRFYGKPIINCNPLGFPNKHILRRGHGLLQTAFTAEETIQVLKELEGTINE